MKLKYFITATFAGLACLGTTLAGSASAGDGASNLKSVASRSKLSKKYTFLDIRLATNGELTGVVFNKKREPVANAAVIVRQAGKEIARTRSDKRGTFVIKNLKPGNYHIIAGTGHGLFRVWSAKAAPPKAFKTIKIMSDKSVIRAQGPNQIVVDRETGETYGQVHIYDGGGLQPAIGPPAFMGPPAGLGAFGILDTLTTAAALTAAGFAIDNYNSLRDLENRLVVPVTSN